MLIWSTLFKFAKIGDLEIDNTLSLTFKRELVETRCPIKILWKQSLALLCEILRIWLIISWILKLKNYYGAAFFKIFCFCFSGNPSNFLLSRPPLQRGGRNYILNSLSFNSKVLAYQYIYHKEL